MSSSSSSSPLREQIIATAKGFTKAHSDLDLEAIRSFFAPDFVGRFNQTSLPAHTLGDKDGDAYIAWQAETYPLFKSYDAQLVDVVVDEAQLKAALYIAVVGEPAVPGLTELYKSRYIHTITVTEDGKLVRVFDSFVDSAVMLDYIAKVTAAQGEGKK
ncbi:hypothetical protein QBC43DRAFT_361901 [Cladorrhinum sp. PSN259]|nr:hypothetical protein QBC43DRAFT_361901 [Cladorrhinum sp. PSN259]